MEASPADIQSDPRFTSLINSIPKRLLGFNSHKIIVLIKLLLSLKALPAPMLPVLCERVHTVAPYIPPQTMMATAILLEKSGYDASAIRSAKKQEVTNKQHAPQNIQHSIII